MSTSNSSSTSSMSNPVVATWDQQRRTLPELLASRETFGKPSSGAWSGTYRQHRGVPLPVLASRGAWNPLRLQNMILAVGPGTPASVILVPPSSAQSSSSSSEALSDTDSEEAGESAEIPRVAGGNEGASAQSREVSARADDEGGAEDDEDEDAQPRRRGRWTRRTQSDDEDDDSSRNSAQRILENAIMQWYAADDDSEEEDEAGNSTTTRAPTTPAPSLRHGGCINTAAWIDCGWRISSAEPHSEAVVTEDCPTQLVTSGDDHLVKFWDVRHAMGTTSPLPGGYDTLCPFSAPHCSDAEESRKRWKRHYSKTQSSSESTVGCVAGSVLPLATLHTGHRGNVFHVTPMRGKPGKVATCGADGFLKVSDLETGDTDDIISPDFEDDMGGLLPAGLMSLRPGMCFSHHFLSENTGLVCSERGLRRFDLRLPPSQQPTSNLLGAKFRTCKACSVWSSSASAEEEGDSAYVFAGGSSAEVAMCDLRMVDGNSSRVVQYYRPQGLAMACHVSVSGLDLSRDRQELLVSYESDQIYTFPVFPQATSSAGPTVDQIGDLCTTAENGRVKTLNELAAYGGHLNRFTFLKNARYAGPRDEYICTGSDSGHAWIYEKATGAVVSFLNADHSTCNGVVPHPSLPVFITYGIDSTAKLWRGTTPVGVDVDDSPEGRRQCFRESEYEMSPTVRKWGEVQSALEILESEDCDETAILPDHMPSMSVIRQPGRFGRHFLRRDGSRGSRLGNDLHNLSDTLKQNLYACLRSLVDGDDVPVESDIESLKRRISLIRLRNQADRLGLPWNPSIPWQLEPGMGKSAEVHPADLVPDCPADWIPYDPETSKTPWDFKNYFNTKEYGAFYGQKYGQFWNSVVCDTTEIPENNESLEAKASGADTPLPDSEDQPARKQSKRVSRNKVSSSEEDLEEDDEMKYVLSVYTLMHDTMLVLKNGGNAALKAGDWDSAARRYDKAIQYGAVASMSFPSRSLDFAGGRREKLKANGGYHLEWGPLIKVLIACRLNLALLMLKAYFSHPEHAVEQARLALHDLRPFCVKEGKVMKGNKLDKVHRCDEPAETYTEATTLQAKSFFRLGSAYFELGQYSEAVSSYEKSVKCTEQAKSEPDNLVLRRLQEAKRENSRQNKKRRKKFKLAFECDSAIRAYGEDEDD